jgi:tryptophanyl-tRNA synthetase
MKKVLTGVQATGDLHIGNYLGVIKSLVDWQKDAQCYYFVPNLHSLNIRPDAKKLNEETYANVAWFLAAGIDPNKSLIYVQSLVPAISELCWILNNFVTMGELSRMTQYKDKSIDRDEKGQLVALFAYPVLMAADILLFDANIIPVGDDQKQHVELTRDIATRFNNIYGNIFTVPEPVMETIGARVMNLQNPAKKMSKSDDNQSGNVMLLDKPDLISEKIKRAVTDSGNSIEASDDKPAITNLLQIYAGFGNKKIEEVQDMYVGKSYGEFKDDLSELVLKEISLLQTRYNQLISDKHKLGSLIRESSAKASRIADKKLDQIKQKLGLF